MKASVDISLYPLKEDFVPPIREFIERISAYPNVHVTRTDLSTQLFGDYDEVMDLLKTEIGYSWEKWGKGTFVIKLLLDDLRGLSQD